MILLIFAAIHLLVAVILMFVLLQVNSYTISSQSSYQLPQENLDFQERAYGHLKRLPPKESKTGGINSDKTGKQRMRFANLREFLAVRNRKRRKQSAFRNELRAHRGTTNDIYTSTAGQKNGAQKDIAFVKVVEDDGRTSFGEYFWLSLPPRSLLRVTDICDFVQNITMLRSAST